MPSFGGPDVLTWTSVADPACAADEVVVRVLACGVNHCDLDSRAGVSRWTFELPMVLGGEFAGVVADVGREVHDVRLGDHVAVLQHYRADDGRLVQFGIDCWGGYGEFVAVPARALVPLSSPTDVEAAASGQTVASTAWRMVTTLGQVRPDETVLVPSASGGVGSALVGAAALRGARVIATVGAPDKVEQVRELGADAVLCHRDVALRDAVAELTSGAGVDCVLDTVGGPQLQDHLATLRLDGRYVICGAHAGEVVELDLVALFQHGHRLLGFGFCTEAELRESLAHVLEGRLRVPVAARYPLSEAAAAHRDMGRRQHVGKLLLQAVEDRGR
ncbi:MAG TPA: zinc-binding dehydrogenase [Baekduia sp.]|nr:zinc-binding dehydrogenase [Baekduia sp.]